jgi:dolichyl-diphosphooligosaccharide--protein glycosyltransferase
VAVGLAIRIVGPWSTVLTPTHLNFLDGDAWYHLRAIEHAVANFPHRLTHDPYGLHGGIYVAVAPLFDIVVAGAALVVGLGSPSPWLVGRVAAFMPPLMGGLTIVLVFATARRRAGPLAGLLAASLAAILPGHFLDRTLLGFVDHHALEALLAVTILYLLVRGVERDAPWRSIGAGLALSIAAYVLTWTSAAFLLAIVGAWLAIHAAWHFWRRADPGPAPRIVGAGAAGALAIFLLTQDRDASRYAMRIVALGGLAGLAGVVTLGQHGVARNWWRARAAFGGMLVAAAGGVAVVAVVYPEMVSGIAGELIRFTPSLERMQVAEARPLFLYEGRFSWRPPWLFFRSGFWVGLLAIVALMLNVVRRQEAADLLLATWTAAMYLATFGQNRFGYYLVPIVAIAGGCLCAWVIEEGRRRGGFSRSAAVVAVAGLVFGPSLVPAIWTTGRPSGLRPTWLPAFEWLRDNTPEPFGDSRYYYARYDNGSPRSESFSVMAWWDYGYWVTQISRRVPTANPTQAGAPVTGGFFVETDPVRAARLLAGQQSRYVLVDDTLPFRAVSPGRVTGQFSSLAVWAGAAPKRFFDTFLVPENGQYRPMLLYFSDYYETMAFRLGVAAGNETRAEGSLVVSWAWRDVPGVAGRSRVLTGLREFSTHEEARRYLASLGPGDHAIAGRNPYRTAVDLPAVPGLRRVFRTPAPGAFGEGEVQIYEVRP